MRWCMLGAMLVRLASGDDDLYGYGYRDDENVFSCSEKALGWIHTLHPHLGVTLALPDP